MLVFTWVILSVQLASLTAYPWYRDRIPNARKVLNPCNNQLIKAIGHMDPQGGGIRNTFGRDFKIAGSRWSEKLCKRDSDGDGITNGEELGDPDCVWKRGKTPNRTVAITHPAICTPNEKVNCTEICRPLRIRPFEDGDIYFVGCSSVHLPIISLVIASLYVTVNCYL